MWKVQWDNDESRYVCDVGALDALLDELHAFAMGKRPMLVTVESLASGQCLIVGVGASSSVLSHMPADNDPPYLSSVGSCAESGVREFWYMGELSEIPIRNCIDSPLARRAVRHFAETDALSEEVVWEME